MLRRRCAVIAGSLLALSACRDGGSPQARTAHGDEELGATVLELAEEHDLPSFGVLDLAAGTVRVATAGVRSYGSEQDVPLDAPFHLGSNTKAMTATLLATFVDDGVLSFDATLGSIFGDGAVHPSLRQTSLRDVLGHRAGLGDDDLDLRRLHAAPDAVAARAAIVSETLGRPPREPGTFHYANVGYVVAGAAAERLGGEPWEELVAERLFEPLGMDCGFGAPSGPAAPLGHTAGGRAIDEDAPVNDNPAALRPAGGVHCSLRGWAAFVRGALAHARGEASGVLSAGAAQALFAGDDAYVAGWQRHRRDGATMLAHDGSNTLWYARAILLVEQDRALLMATNTGEPEAVDAMDELAARVLAPAPAR